MSNNKKIKSVSTTDAEWQKAEALSIKILGRKNVSGLIAYWINNTKLEKE